MTREVGRAALLILALMLAQPAHAEVMTIRCTEQHVDNSTADVTLIIDTAAKTVVEKYVDATFDGQAVSINGDSATWTIVDGEQTVQTDFDLAKLGGVDSYGSAFVGCGRQ
mgnify:CR=1 FL=1